MKAFSTRDETDKADEADETGSFRSMSSTTSTNYTMPRVRQTVRPLYTIPDEASPDDDDEDAEPSSTAQSEENAADDLPVSAAAQALHQEADALVAMSHHTSDNGESLPESGLEAEPSTVGAGHKRRNPSSSKSVGSLESLSGGLTPVSEAQSSGQDEHGGDDDLLADSLTSPSHAQAVTAQMGQTGQHPLPSESQYGGQAPDELQGSTAQTGALTDRLSSQPSIDPAMLHTPRAMSPPRTPGAPVLPKIDAGPTAVPAELVTLQQADDPAPRSSDNAVVTDSTMFAGLDMM